MMKKTFCQLIIAVVIPLTTIAYFVVDYSHTEQCGNYYDAVNKLYSFSALRF